MFSIASESPLGICSPLHEMSTAGLHARLRHTASRQCNDQLADSTCRSSTVGSSHRQTAQTLDLRWDSGVEYEAEKGRKNGKREQLSIPSRGEKPPLRMSSRSQSWRSVRTIAGRVSDSAWSSSWRGA